MVRDFLGPGDWALKIEGQGEGTNRNIFMEFPAIIKGTITIARPEGLEIGKMFSPMFPPHGDPTSLQTKCKQKGLGNGIPLVRVPVPQVDQVLKSLLDTQVADILTHSLVPLSQVDLAPKSLLDTQVADILTHLYFYLRLT